MPYLDRIKTHAETKPHSIDPFNEAGIPTKDRDGLLISDFLASYEALATSVVEKVNSV